MENTAINILTPFGEKPERFITGHEQVSKNILEYLKGLTIEEVEMILKSTSNQLRKTVI